MIRPSYTVQHFCRVCDKPIVKTGKGGNILFETHCNRYCYELEQQKFSWEDKPLIIHTNCIFCGKEMTLENHVKKNNAWLCGSECVNKKAKVYGRHPYKKFMALLALRVHGPKTADDLGRFLGRMSNKYRFQKNTVSQMLRVFVAKGHVIRHKHPTHPDTKASVYQIAHNLPLDSMGYTLKD